MSTTQVSIRLGVEGKAEVKRAFDEVGKAGQDAFRSLATSMDAAGAASDRETQRLQRLAQAARQVAPIFRRYAACVLVHRRSHSHQNHGAGAWSLDLKMTKLDDVTRHPVTLGPDSYL